MTQSHAFPAGTILGYPRIGPRRELKKALESFWAGRASADEVEATAAALRKRTRDRLTSLGLTTDDAAIPGNFSFYDQVLDAVVLTGAIPSRFADLPSADGRLDLAGYSTLARGRGDDLPLEMTKWFDSNYHYLVPEIGPGTTFRFADDRVVREFTEAKADGVLTRPVLVGPVTFLALGHQYKRASRSTFCHFLNHFRSITAFTILSLMMRISRAGRPYIQSGATLFSESSLMM